jgi:hypothetical protein
MKTSRLIAAFVAACSALGLSLQAAPITYELSNNLPFGFGQYTIRGSITTDGTLGILSYENYTSAEFAIAQGSNVLFDGPARVFFELNVVATEDAILLPAVSGSNMPARITLVNGDGGPDSTYIDWFRDPGFNMGGGDPFFDIPARDYVYAVSVAQLLWDDNVTGAIPTDVNGNWIVASAVASSIPEPSTYGLVVGGLILGGATVRRRNRQQG